MAFVAEPGAGLPARCSGGTRPAGPARATAWGLQPMICGSTTHCHQEIRWNASDLRASP